MIGYGVALIESTLSGLIVGGFLVFAGFNILPRPRHGQDRVRPRDRPPTGAPLWAADWEEPLVPYDNEEAAPATQPNGTSSQPARPPSG